ncbi:MAG: hypothetical protein AVDCRST_MAG89-3666, partial [uncultured Gemmatimonadetes bacterium]
AQAHTRARRTAGRRGGDRRAGPGGHDGQQLRPLHRSRGGRFRAACSHARDAPGPRAPPVPLRGGCARRGDWRRGCARGRHGACAGLLRWPGGPRGPAGPGALDRENRGAPQGTNGGCREGSPRRVQHAGAGDDSPGGDRAHVRAGRAQRRSRSRTPVRRRGFADKSGEGPRGQLSATAAAQPDHRGRARGQRLHERGSRHREAAPRLAARHGHVCGWQRSRTVLRERTVHFAGGRPGSARQRGDEHPLSGTRPGIRAVRGRPHRGRDPGRNAV